jgi:hypothetical protein
MDVWKYCDLALCDKVIIQDLTLWVRVGSYDYYTTAGQIVEGLSQEAYEGYIGGLAEMHDRLLEIAREFLAYGSETDFTRNVTEAIRVSEPIEAVARQRVRNLLEPAAREGGITIVLPE